MSRNQHQHNPIRMPALSPFRHRAAIAGGRRRSWRCLIRLFTYAGAAFWCALAASVATGSGAVAAASTTTTQSFSVAGKYRVTVPADATQVQIEAVGGAGTGGAATPVGQRGTGGSGTDVNETVPVAPGETIVPGENLTVLVGRLGGGAHGGAGGTLGGAGGSGGGATQLLSPAGAALLVAAGGGGGGGASGVFPGTGGAGGTYANGTATYVTGGIAARGGIRGGECASNGLPVDPGAIGETDASDAGGGGGGGGEGLCGGQGGGSGDHGTGKYVGGAPGGGGGAGTDSWLPNPTSLSVTGSSNAGDGSLTITFTLGAPATATFSSSTISFPDQQVGTAGETQYVTLTNNGDLPLTFVGLSTIGDAPDDFIGRFGTCGATIAAHSSCQLGASFSPTASGDRSATLLVSDSASDGPQKIVLTGHATDPPAPATATPSASNLMFGGQEIGTTSTTKQLTLTNNGDLSLTFNGVSVSGPQAADYSVDASNCMGGGAPGWDLLEGAPTFRIGAHSSCVINVKFSPQGPRMRNARLVITDSAADTPQQVNLTGTGLMPPDAVLQATDIAFGAQQLGTSSQVQYVTLDNKGDVPMTIAGISLSGQDVGDFTGDLGTCRAILAAHQSCELGARFTPAALGARSATLLISDDAPGSPQQITLTGTGAPAPAGPQSTTTTTPTAVTVSAPPAQSNHSVTPVTTTTVKRVASRAMCVVPRLRHMTLAQARRALAHAHCGLGTVRSAARRRSHHALRVGRQSTAAGARKHAGYPVSIWLIG